MANSKLVKNRNELELILRAGEKFCRSDQTMTILYRLPVRKFRDEDIVLNLTIGDKFIAAAFGNSFCKYLDPERHCQLGRDSSGLWIKDLGSENGTFVNGIKLDVDVCHILKSGDLISLGFIYEEDKPWMLEIEYFYWVFKVYETPQSEFEHRNAVAREALGTSVIVNQIFSNLGFHDFKSSRSVSKLWDEVAKRKLRTFASVAFLLYDPKMDKVVNGSCRWSDRWLEEAQKKFSTLQKIGIRSICFVNNEINTFDFPTERLIFLQNILANNNNQISSVELDFYLTEESENVRSLFRSILSSPQIIEVTFKTELFEELDEYEELGSNNALVRKLIFQEIQSDYSQILRLFPNTREIELPSKGVAEDFLDEKYEDELEGVKVLKISNKDRNMELYSVYSRPRQDCNYCGDDHETEVGRQSICKLSSLICALPQSFQLTNLEITDCHDFVPNLGLRGGNALYALLSKFKDTLEFLKLGLILHGHAHFKFPEMKMLSVLKLEIQIKSYFYCRSSVTGFGSETFPRLEMLDVVFGKMVDEFAVEFALRNLKCGSDFENRALRQLRFVFPNEELKKEYCQLAEGTFRKIFPNCSTFHFDCNN